MSVEVCYPGHWPFTPGRGCRKEEEGVGARGGEGDELRRVSEEACLGRALGKNACPRVVEEMKGEREGWRERKERQETRALTHTLLSMNRISHKTLPVITQTPRVISSAEAFFIPS